MSEPKSESTKDDEQPTKDILAEENKRLKAQLHQALELAKYRDSEQARKDDAEKAVFIVDLSRGKFRMARDVLSKLSLRQLRWLDNICRQYRLDVDATIQKVAAEDAAGKIKKDLTVGEWDPEWKEWKTT